MAKHAQSKSKRDRDPFMVVTAIFEFVKGLTMIAVTAGVANLFHKDVRSEVERWLNILRVDPDNQYVGGLLQKLNLVHTKELEQLTALGCCYAALFLTEGVGLMLRQNWALWLTVIATGLLLPIEIYEMMQSFTGLKLALFCVNVVVVSFLGWRIRRQRAES